MSTYGSSMDDPTGSEPALQVAIDVPLSEVAPIDVT
jgi:hypothetical protein